MRISTVGLLTGLDIGYCNVKGFGGSLNDSYLSEFILPWLTMRVSAKPMRGLSADLKGIEVFNICGEEKLGDSRTPVQCEAIAVC